MPAQVTPVPDRLAPQIAAATTARLLINTARRFVYPFAPVLSRGMGVPLVAVTSLIAVNQATGLLSPFFGPASDRWGYRTMLLAGLGLLAVGLLAAGLLPFYGVVLVALFLAGLSKSIFDPALQAYVGERVPYGRRGLVIGIVELGWSGSSLLGIPLVGVLIGWWGWRSPFLVLGGLTLLVLALLGLLLPARPRAARPAGGLAGFDEAWRQLRAERTALAALGFGFMVSAANDNLFVVYGVWLEDTFALTTIALGVATTAIGAAEMLGEILTASIADRLGLRRMVLLGLLLSTLSYMLLPLLGQSLPLALLGLFIVFITFEFAVVTSISLITEVLPSARATMMASLMAFMSAGRVVGALIGGPVWLAGGITATGLVSAGLSGLALLCLLWGWQDRPGTGR